MRYREAVVAGQFYPQSAATLRADIDSFLTPPEKPEIHAHALIVPHAGYCYSGAIAGGAYAYLKAFADDIKRVIILGPSHRVALRGCALCDYDAFTSPLGEIEVADQGYEQLLQLDAVQITDPAHQLEHSLEVQLPFLQSCLNDFKIVPIVVGYCPPHIITRILTLLDVNNASTLVVVSSDLSHYHPYLQAQKLDNKSINKILNYDSTLTGEDACGCFSVNGLLDYAKREKWKIKLIKKANSGDIVSSHKNEVVGYASFVLY
ncbi:MAG: AmmeMemoRadiSam system protein B [Psychromonas sp.]|nr:AmmeMemoRadiSam system protein B [Psychromonas sp.]